MDRKRRIPLSWAALLGGYVSKSRPEVLAPADHRREGAAAGW